MTTATEPKKDTLFEVTDDLLALDQLLTESEGELTPEIEAWREEYAAKIRDKADGIGWYAKRLQNEAEFFKAQRDELAAKARRAERKLEWLKGYIAYCMARLETRKIEGKVYTLALQKNGGKPPLEILEPFKSDPAQLPAEFQRVTVSANTDALRIAAEEGMADEVVRLLPAGESVRIR